MEINWSNLPSPALFALFASAVATEMYCHGTPKGDWFRCRLIKFISLFVGFYILFSVLAKFTRETVTFTQRTKRRLKNKGH